MKNVTIKKLEVQVTYSVGLGEVEMPEFVYHQLFAAAKNNEKFESGAVGEALYPDAYEWLVHNINDRHSKEWSAEIEHISNPKKITNENT